MINHKPEDIERAARWFQALTAGPAQDHKYAYIILQILEHYKQAQWRPKEDFEKHGEEVIAWISSNKGFADVTARLFYIDLEQLPNLPTNVYPITGWYWGESEDPVKRPDLINGVKDWPKPPEGEKHVS